MLSPRAADKAKASGFDLYEQLDRYYADAARDLYLGAPHDDGDLVYYLLPCFQRYCAGAQSVSRLLNYVNRHYIKRAVDENHGWLRLVDVLDAVARTLQEDDTREKIQRRLRERRVEELRKWGYDGGGDATLLAQAEACAEAASPPDRIISLALLVQICVRERCIADVEAHWRDNGRGERLTKAVSMPWYEE